MFLPQPEVVTDTDNLRGCFIYEKPSGTYCWWDGGVSEERWCNEVPWANKDRSSSIATGLWTTLCEPIFASASLLNVLPGMVLTGYIDNDTLHVDTIPPYQKVFEDFSYGTKIQFTKEEIDEFYEITNEFDDYDIWDYTVELLDMEMYLSHYITGVRIIDRVKLSPVESIAQQQFQSFKKGRKGEIVIVKPNYVWNRKNSKGFMVYEPQEK